MTPANSSGGKVGALIERLVDTFLLITNAILLVALVWVIVAIFQVKP